MSVKVDLLNTIWCDDMVSVIIEEPYVYLDEYTIWKNENNEDILIKPPNFREPYVYLTKG